MIRTLLLFAIGATSGLVASEFAKLAGGGAALRIGSAFLAGLLMAVLVVPRLPK